jgi:hypothetical protein
MRFFRLPKRQSLCEKCRFLTQREIWDTVASWTSSGLHQVARWNSIFIVTFEDGPFLASSARSKTFRVESNSYNEPNQIAMGFQSLRNGGVLALTETRRSGAQRGASENNFGQRFSVSTPCFLSSRTALTPPPPLSL